MPGVKVMSCVLCGHFYSPPVYFCSSCRSKKLVETEIPGKGVLYTYTTVTVPIPTLQKEAPYILVIVEFKEDFKITGRLMKPFPESIAIGDRVELIEIRDGIYFFGYANNEYQKDEIHP